MGYLYRRGRIWWAKYYVNDRYNIVAEGDLQEAARKLTGTISGTVGAFTLDPRPVSV